MKIGDYIKEKRLQLGLTQDDLAIKCEVTTRTIQRIENGEVDPRSYTLQAIASALQIDYHELINQGKENEENTRISKIQTNESFWLAILHFSGFLLLIIPTVIIWTIKKEEITGIRSHAIDSINFQLSMYLYLLISGFLSILLIGIPIIIILGIYFATIVIINTAKVANNQSYRYLLSIKFLKK